jgi:hypothetical protein
MSWTCIESNHEVKARKEHHCFCCGEPISKGSIYITRAGVGYDGFFRMQMHPECEKATSEWGPDDWECFSEGTLKRATEELK